MRDNSKQKLEVLIEALSHYRNKLQKIDYVHDQGGFIQEMIELRRFVSAYDDQNVIELFFHSDYCHKNKEYFTHLNEYYLRSIEANEAINLAQSKTGSVTDYFAEYGIQQISERFNSKYEVLSQIDFKSIDNFIVIGCGPMPETLLFVSENYGLKKTLGIDINHEAVFISGMMLNSIGKKDITVEQEDGNDYDYSKYDLVYIPLFIPGKSQILSRIADTGSPSTKIVVNSPIGLNRLFYDGIEPLDTRLKIEHTNIQHREFNTLETLTIGFYNL